MELNIWTSTTVQRIERDDAEDEFVVTLVKADGSKQVLRPKHVITALGWSLPNMPDITGMNEFRGQIMHSLSYKLAKDHIGKKAVVVGACTSAHDIARDLQRNGVDVTMVQRSSTCVISVKKGLPAYLHGYREGGPPVEIADLISASVPMCVLKQLHKLGMKQVIENDREMLEGLQRVGFKTNLGEDDSGFYTMVFTRAGGYYFDVGASQLIIDGQIKLKNGSVKTFTDDSLIFEDGSQLKADVVVFATGLLDALQTLKPLMGGDLISKIQPMWGLTDEGEISGVWRNCGIPNFYSMLGNLAFSRFHSTHIALQIQAKEEGLYISTYDD